MSPEELAGLGEEEANATVTEDGNNEKTDFEELYKKSQAELKETKDSNSSLGRKFKAYQEDSESRYDSVLEKISDLENTRANKEYNEEDESEDERIARIADERADRKIEQREAARLKGEKAYIRDYQATVAALGDELDAGEYEAVLQEMQTMTGYSENGSDDAQKNFDKAYIKVLRGGRSGGGNSSFREKDPKGTKIGGDNGSGGKDTKVAVEIEKAKNDPYVNGFLAYRGRNKSDNEDFLKRAFASNVEKV